MREGWVTYKIENILSKIIDNRGKNPPFSGVGYPYVDTTCIVGNNRFPDYSLIRKYIAEDTYNSWFRSGHPTKNDLLIATVGANIGKICLMDETKTCIAQNTVGLRVKPKIADPIFVYYVLSSNGVQAHLKSLDVGSAQPSIKVPHLLNVNIVLPNLPTQTRIATILSALDDKIELNRQTNATLEAIAQAIFKEWFVNFRSPGATGEMQTACALHADRDSKFDPIPKGWRVGKLGEVITNFDSKRVPLSSRERETIKGIYPYYGAASILDYVENYLFDGVYLLMGEDGTVITDDEKPVLQYISGKFWVNNHAHVIQGKGAFSTEFILLLLKNANIKHIVTGAVQPKINQANMNSLPVIIPDANTLDTFQVIIKSIFTQIIENEQQSATFTAIRDALLPKLMNGEIEV